MAAQRVLQLLRSSNTYESFALAESAIREITGKKDGEIVLARYISGTSGEPAVNTYESAIGVYFETQNRWTVFKSSTELQAALDALQAELDATQAGAGLGTNGSYTAPAAPAASEDSENGYDVIGTATSLNDAVNKIAIAIEAMDHNNNYTAGATPSVTDASKVIAGINQTDGKIDSVTTDAVDLLLTGYANDGTTNTGSIVATDTVKTALNKLENATAAGVQISSQTGNQLHRLTTTGQEGLATKLSIAALDANEIANLQDGANVREAYKLVDLNAADATAGIGLPIKIYKDSALTDVYVGHVDDVFLNPISGQDDITDSYTNKATDIDDGSGDDALCFVYHKADGNYQLVAVNVESFLQESEFGDGLQVVSNVVSVKKDTSSEQVYTAASTAAADVLTVSSNGVKVANVQAAINYATDQVLDTTVTASSERGVYGESSTTPHISITESTDSTTGLHSYAITETDIASEDELDAEITRAESAETAIDAAVGLTKAANAETRSYTSQVTLHGSETAPTTVAGDIDLLNSHVEVLDGAAVKSVTGSDAININTTSPNDAQNPKVELKLSAQAATTTADAQYAGGNNTSNILQIKSDGLYLDNVWDCGQY